MVIPDFVPWMAQIHPFKYYHCSCEKKKGEKLLQNNHTKNVNVYEQQMLFTNFKAWNNSRQVDMPFKSIWLYSNPTHTHAHTHTHLYVHIAMAQMFQKWITVTAENPCCHHSDIYLYLSISFLSLLLTTLPSLYNLFPLVLNSRKTHILRKSFLK